MHVVTPDGSRPVHPLGAPRRRAGSGVSTLPCPQALDIGTDVGEKYRAVELHGRGCPTYVRLSNGCTQLQRLPGRAQLTPAQPATGGCGPDRCGTAPQLLASHLLAVLATRSDLSATTLSLPGPHFDHVTLTITSLDHVWAAGAEHGIAALTPVSRSLPGPAINLSFPGHRSGSRHHRAHAGHHCHPRL